MLSDHLQRFLAVRCDGEGNAFPLENIRKRADDVRFIIRDENRYRSQRFNLSRNEVRKGWRFEMDGSPKYVQDVC